MTYLRSPCSNMRPARPRQCPRGGPPPQSPNPSHFQRPRLPEQLPVSSKKNPVHIALYLRYIVQCRSTIYHALYRRKGTTVAKQASGPFGTWNDKSVADG